MVVAGGDVRRVGAVKAAQGEQADAAEEAQGEGYVVYGLFHFVRRV